MTVTPFPRRRDHETRQFIGRYEILETLGRGSMGVVYLARDPLIGRKVALKTLSAAHPLSSERLDSLRRHLLNEAASAGGLSHPGIVTIHDVIDDGSTGRVSIAMEYVPGETLKRHIESSAHLSLDFIAEVVSRIAEVLDFAHSQGVVHRDIKPANVIFTDDRRVKITDFGIASLRGRDLAHELKAMGTPSYLAPERLLGQDADYRADVYSLGVMLYEMLTGHLPFHGDSLAELARNTVEMDFTPPERFRPDLLPGLRVILERALAKDPDDRYSSAGRLAADLRSVVDVQGRLSKTRIITRVIPTPEPPPTPPQEQPPSTARTWQARLSSLLASATARLLPDSLSARSRWTLVGAVAMLAVVVVLVSLSGFSGARSKATSEPPTVADPSARDDYLDLLERVQALYERGDTEAADRLVARAEASMPEAARIREMRQEARWRAAADEATLRVVQVVELLDAAATGLGRGSFGTAEAAIYKALELDPGNEEALSLRASLNRARRAELRRRAAASAPAPRPEPEPEPQFEPFQITQAPSPAPPPRFGMLKIDFHSEIPRGVLTVYLANEQLLRREYRYFDKRGLLRRRGKSGGFDLQQRLAAGDLDFKVYLAVPDRPTLVESIRGTLPGGSVRTLAIRVDQAGALGLDYH